MSERRYDGPSGVVKPGFYICPRCGKARSSDEAIRVRVRMYRGAPQLVCAGCFESDRDKYELVSAPAG